MGPGAQGLVEAWSRGGGWESREPSCGTRLWNMVTVEGSDCWWAREYQVLDLPCVASCCLCSGVPCAWCQIYFGEGAWSSLSNIVRTCLRHLSLLPSGLSPQVLRGSFPYVHPGCQHPCGNRVWAWTRVQHLGPGLGQPRPPLPHRSPGQTEARGDCSPSFVRVPDAHASLPLRPAGHTLTSSCSPCSPAQPAAL